MPQLGRGELALIFAALFLVFSAGRLGAVGDALGRLLRGKKPPAN